MPHPELLDAPEIWTGEDLRGYGYRSGLTISQYNSLATSSKEFLGEHYFGEDAVRGVDYQFLALRGFGNLDIHQLWDGELLPPPTAGLPASPLPEVITPIIPAGVPMPGPVGPLVASDPIVMGIRALFAAIAKRVGISGGWRGAITSLMGVLGVTQVIDIVDGLIPGLGDDEKENIAAMVEAFAVLEDAGLIHPWRPRPRRDGTPAPGPFYLIFDIIQIQGHYTNFHMSRSGLQTHDDKQDTYKRPRRARRSNRKPS